MSSHRTAIIVLLSAIFVALLGVGIIVPILPVYATDMGATGLMLGIMVGIFSVFHTISFPRWFIRFAIPGSGVHYKARLL